MKHVFKHFKHISLSPSLPRLQEVVLYSWTSHRLRARFKGPTKDISQVT